MDPGMTGGTRLLEPGEAVSLPEPLACEAGFAGLDPWLDFVHRTYSLPVYRLVHEVEDRIEGWLALVRVRHPIFGHYLTTSPFASYGGFAWASSEARDALLEAARGLGNELGTGYVGVRFDGSATPSDGWTQHPVYATYLVALAPDPGELMSLYSSDHRNHIRKSLRKGFTIEFGHLDLLDDTYEILAQSMHELGSPYHSRAYLQVMAATLGSALEFAVVRSPAREGVGAGVFIRQGERVSNLHANILRQFRSEYAGEFLYWSTIERYSRAGLQIFDLGRSLIGSGNERFKMKWRPSRKPLAYWYALMPGHSLPELHQKNPRFQLAIQVWQRLPPFAVRLLGPLLIRGLA